MDDNTRAKLAEISAQWRSAGKIGPAVSKSVSQAYELGKAEGIKEGMRMAAEKLVAGKKPCDCIKPVGPEGALVPYDCYCGNHGDIADAAAWCAVENAKAAILKEAGE